MKTKVVILLALTAKLSYCQPVAHYDKRIVEEYTEIGILEAPFMIDELIEIYKKDSLVIKRIFNREAFKRTQYTLYCYNVCAEFFSKRLNESSKKYNREIVNKILSELDYDKNIVKPQIDWSRIFETCLSCPFGEYPDEMIFYFKFSVLFMDKAEIMAMVKDEDGKQWKYVLEICFRRY